MNDAQEDAGDFIASFEVSLVVDLGLSKNLPLDLFPSKEYFIRDFMFQVLCKHIIDYWDRDILPLKKTRKTRGIRFRSGKEQLLPGQAVGEEVGEEID